jgi:hypothetical protein
MQGQCLAGKGGANTGAAAVATTTPPNFGIQLGRGLAQRAAEHDGLAAAH